MSKRVPVRNKANVRQAATAHMTTLKQTPKRVIGCFQDRQGKMQVKTSSGRINSEVRPSRAWPRYN